MKEPLYKLTLDGATLHLSKGNSKIGKGIWSFSTLPGNENHLLRTKTKGLLTNIPGTCSKHCEACFDDGCYAVSSAKRYQKTVIPAWGDNTILLRNGEIWSQLETFLTLKNAKAIKALKAGGSADESHELAGVKVFRQNVSGEIESADELRKWVALAKKHPETIFYVYTKNFEALGDYLDAGEDFPENYTVNVSQWNHVADGFLAKYAWAKLNVFEFDPTNRKDCDWSDEEKARLAKIPHCPGVTSKGRHAKRPDGSAITCDTCGICIKKTGRTIAVWSH